MQKKSAALLLYTVYCTSSLAALFAEATRLALCLDLETRIKFWSALKLDWGFAFSRCSSRSHNPSPLQLACVFDSFPTRALLAATRDPSPLTFRLCSLAMLS